MGGCSPPDSPIIESDKFCKEQSPINEIERHQMDQCPYATAAVGSLMYDKHALDLISALHSACLVDIKVIQE